MEGISIFVGKFLPPQKGHIWAIKEASKMCSILYVIVCFEPNVTKSLCEKAGFEFITLQQKMEWLKAELPYPNIKIVGVDETGVPPYPEGWLEWSERIKQTIPQKIDLIFGNEKSYVEGYKKYFPDSQYIMFDVDRKTVPISSTKIRENFIKNFDYIIESAKPFFEKSLMK